MKKYPGLVPALIAALLLVGCGPSPKERQAEAARAEQAAAGVRAKEQAEHTQEPAVTEAPAKFKGLTAARVESGYAAVLYESGRKGMLPLASLTAEETGWVTAFAAAHPLAHGKSTMVTAKAEVKKTIEKQSIENGVETVQLCAPAKLRDQIGATCMFYGRVHYLDIAGYPVEDGEIYQVINNASTDRPFDDYRYHIRMQMLFIKQKPTPLVHYPEGKLSPFEWARQELRKGRPVLSSLPLDIWMSLPAEFLATHPFDGNSKIGHQVVINGFTYNPATEKGTLHVVNSWRALAEFDVPVEKKDEQRIIIEQSLSPRGELPEQAVKIIAGNVTELKPVGKQFLYAVETNQGPQRVVAVSAAAARAVVEADQSAHDLETVFAGYVVSLYDYIYWYAEPGTRDATAARIMSEIFKIPETVALPHVDFEARSSAGNVYFVRVAPLRVVKLPAASSGEALAKARLVAPPPS